VEAAFFFTSFSVLSYFAAIRSCLLSSRRLERGGALVLFLPFWQPSFKSLPLPLFLFPSSESIFVLTADAQHRQGPHSSPGGAPYRTEICFFFVSLVTTGRGKRSGTLALPGRFFPAGTRKLPPDRSHLPGWQIA